MTKKPNEEQTLPINDEELREAVLRSGYPLEVRLLDAFNAGGMDARVGLRSRAAGLSDTREIDVNARLSVDLLPRGDSLKGACTLVFDLLVEAKSLEKSAAFVGFPWRRPAEYELQIRRARLAGRPSYGVRADVAPVEMWGAISKPNGLCEALAPLSGGPVCVQWALVRRPKGGGDHIAQHDHWTSIDALVRAAQWEAERRSDPTLGSSGVLMSIMQPTLVVATPNLFLYDALTGAIEKTDHFTLLRHFDVGATVVQVALDVVTEEGVPALIARYKTAAELVATVLERDGWTFSVQAELQRREYLDEQTARASQESART